MKIPHVIYGALFYKWLQLISHFIRIITTQNSFLGEEKTHPDSALNKHNFCLATWLKASYIFANLTEST